METEMEQNTNDKIFFIIIRKLISRVYTQYLKKTNNIKNNQRKSKRIYFDLFFFNNIKYIIHIIFFIYLKYYL